MRDQEYPRVLVLAHTPFSSDRGNGATMTNLFRGWPADRLLQLYIPFVSERPPSYDVCQEFWKLTPKGASLDQPQAKVSSKGGPKKFLRRALLAIKDKKAVRYFVPYFREQAYARPTLVEGDFEKRIRSFQPDLIYTTLGSLTLTLLSRELGQKLSVPVVPHIFDDFLSTEYRKGFRGEAMNRTMNEGIRSIFDKAPKALVISDVMAQEFERRYGRSFEVFANCVERSSSTAPQRNSGAGEIKLVYGGSLQLDRWKSLGRLADGLAILAAKGIQLKLEINTSAEYVNLYGAELSVHPFVSLRSPQGREELEASLQSADFLVHAESFDPKFWQYIQFSLSTKIPEYYVHGKPIIVVAPAGTGSIEYVRAMGGGLAIDVEDPALIAKAIEPLIADENLRSELAKRSFQVGSERHEATEQREQFRRALLASVT